MANNPFLPSSIRIGPHGQLPSTTLHNLGRINVFCGKNTSGKSTVLTALDAETRQDGVVIDQNALRHQLAKSETQILGLTNHLSIGHWEHVFFTAACRDDGYLWFSGEKEEFVERSVTDSKQRNWFHAWHPTLPQVVFDPFFPIPIREAIKLPETRRLELRVMVHTAPVPSASGENLLAYLYLAKTRRSNDPHHKLFERVSEGFTQISEGWRFDVVPSERQPNSNQTTVELIFSRDDDTWVDAETCGFGLQELILLLYFALEPQHPIVCIEEPETHMHPDMQRRVALYLRDSTTKQFFISTHSNVWLRPVIADAVFQVSFKNGVVQLSDATSRSALLTELGYDVVDNLVSDVVVIVEGPTDIPVLEEFLEKMGVLQSYRVRFWTLSGDNMSRVDLNPLLEHHRALAIVDGDPGSVAARQRFIEQCESLGIHVTHLSRRAIENYFTVDALRSVFKGNLRSQVTAIGPTDDVAKVLGLNPKRRNGEVAKAMRLSDVEGTDLFEFLRNVEKACSESRIADGSSNSRAL